LPASSTAPSAVIHCVRGRIVTSPTGAPSRVSQSASWRSLRVAPA
jgi:hypothetical protein